MAFSDACEAEVATQISRVRRQLRRKGLRLSRRPAAERATAGDGYHVILYDSIVFGFDGNPWAASLPDVEAYARDVRVEVWDHRHSFSSIDRKGTTTMTNATDFPSVSAILARTYPCNCSECAVEAQLHGELGADMDSTSAAAEARRYELRVKASKRRKVTGELTAYQIASLKTDEERLGAIVARLEKLLDGRKARPIACSAFWALRDDYAPMHQGFVPLPSRVEHDAMLMKFARPKRKAA